MSARIGRAFLLVAALAAIGAGATALLEVSLDEARVLDQIWRGIGLLTFAGVFAWLASDPGSTALWVVALANKLALTLTGLVLLVGSRPGIAGEFLIWDGSLFLLLCAAWMLTRGARPQSA